MTYKFNLVTITDLSGSTVNNYDHIIINVVITIIKDNNSDHFIKIDNPNNIYRINLPVLYQHIENQYPVFSGHIDMYIPLGDIQINPINPINPTNTINLFMANTLYVPTSKIYERYPMMNHMWYAILRKGDKACQSLGLIRSDKKPTHAVPVFQKEYMIRINRPSIDHNYISYKDYGFWILNKHLLTNKIVHVTDTMMMDDDPINHMTYNNGQYGDNKKLVLREKENPWFEEPLIIGQTNVNHPFPYKINGRVDENQPTNDLYTGRYTDQSNVRYKSINNKLDTIYNNATDEDNLDQTNNNTIIVIVSAILFFLLLYRILKR